MVKKKYTLAKDEVYPVYSESEFKSVYNTDVELNENLMKEYLEAKKNFFRLRNIIKDKLEKDSD